MQIPEFHTINLFVFLCSITVSLVVLGEHDLTLPESGKEQFFGVSAIYIQPSWNRDLTAGSVENSFLFILILFYYFKRLIIANCAVNIGHYFCSLLLYL